MAAGGSFPCNQRLPRSQRSIALQCSCHPRGGKPPHHLDAQATSERLACQCGDEAHARWHGASRLSSGGPPTGHTAWARTPHAWYCRVQLWLHAGCAPPFRQTPQSFPCLPGGARCQVQPSLGFRSSKCSTKSAAVYQKAADGHSHVADPMQRAWYGMCMECTQRTRRPRPQAWRSLREAPHTHINGNQSP